MEIGTGVSAFPLTSVYGLGGVFSQVSPLPLPLVKGSDVLAALLINARVQPHEQNLPQTTICRNRPLKEMLRSNICSEFS